MYIFLKLKLQLIKGFFKNKVKLLIVIQNIKYVSA